MAWLLVVVLFCIFLVVLRKKEGFWWVRPGTAPAMEDSLAMSNYYLLSHGYYPASRYSFNY